MRKLSERPAQRRKLMPITLEGKHFAQSGKTVFHLISAGDKAAMAAMRAIVEPSKGRFQGTAARVPFVAIMEHVAVPAAVIFEAGVAGGIFGWLSRPQAVQPVAVALQIMEGGSTGVRRRRFATWLRALQPVWVQ
jgi:hypothetical protein